MGAVGPCAVLHPTPGIKHFSLTNPPAPDAPVPHPTLSIISSPQIWSCRASERHRMRIIRVLSLQQPGAAPNHSKIPSTSSGSAPSWHKAPGSLRQAHEGWGILISPSPLQVISSVYALWSSLGVSEQNKCHF